MSTQIENYTVESDGLTLSKIVWRRYRRPVPGIVEQTLALNPGLAEKGELIPRGTVIKVPVVTPPPPTRRQLVKLW